MKEPPPLQDLRYRYAVDPTPFAVGGMGVIWKAVDEDLERSIAVKSLKAEFATHRSAYERLARETRVLSLLSHPGICHIYDRYLLSDPPCYTMELVDGITLGSAIQRLHGSRDPAAAQLRELIVSLVSIANTIAYAHEQGVLHRDLKPENILLGTFGEVFVMDWGIAALIGVADPLGFAGPGASDPLLSKSGEVIGTPAYLSPEQARGDLEHTDERTDVFGLGAILYEILSGCPPKTLFRGSSAGSHRAGSRVDESPLLSWTPPDLMACCIKALADDPGDRYQSAEAFRRDLDRFLSGGLVGAATYSPTQRAWKWIDRNRKGAQLAAVVAGLALVLLLLGLVRYVSGIRAAGLQTEFALVESRRAQGTLLLDGDRPREAVESFRAAIELEERLGVDTLPTKLYLGESLQAVGSPILTWTANARAAGASWASTAVTPSGDVLYCGGTEGGITAYEVLTGRELRRIPTGSRPAQIHLTDDGAWLAASFPEDGTVAIWEAGADEPARTIQFDALHGSGTFSLSSDGTTLVARCAGDAIQVCDLGSPQEPLKVIHLLGPCSSMCLSADGLFLAAGLSPSTVALVDLRLGEILWTWKVTSQGEFQVEFSADEAFVLAGGSSREMVALRCIDGELASKALNQRYQIHGVSECMGGAGVAFSCDNDGAVYVLEQPTLVEIRRLHVDGAQILDVHGAGGDRIVVTKRDGSWSLWGESAGLKADSRVLTGPIDGIGTALGGTVLVTASSLSSLELWDTLTGKRLHASARALESETMLSVSPDSTEIVTASPSAGDVVQWDLFDLVPIRTLHSKAAVGDRPEYSASGDMLLTLDRDSVIQVWSRDDGARLSSITAGESSNGKGLWSATFSPDGLAIVGVAHGPPLLSVWSLESGELLRDSGPELLGAGYTLQFTPDGQAFFLGEWSGHVRRGSLDSLETTSALVHSGPVLSIALSKDGLWLLTTGWDGECRLIDTTTMGWRWEFEAGGREFVDSTEGAGGVFLASDSEGPVFAFDPGYSDDYAEHQKKVQAAQTLLYSRPGDGAALEVIAEWCVFRKDWGLARKFFHMAQESDEQVDPVLLGMACWCSGHPEEAIGHFEAAQEGGWIEDLRAKLILRALRAELAEASR